MKRLVALSILALFAIVPLVAHSTDGWMVRADRSTNASDPDEAGEIQFMVMGSGFHAINPQAAVFRKPANSVSGTYTLKGSFTLMEPSSHNKLLRPRVRRKRSRGRRPDVSVFPGRAGRELAYHIAVKPLLGVV